jgi:hypothetical protein
MSGLLLSLILHVGLILSFRVAPAPPIEVAPRGPTLTWIMPLAARPPVLAAAPLIATPARPERGASIPAAPTRAPRAATSTAATPAATAATTAATTAAARPPALAETVPRASGPSSAVPAPPVAVPPDPARQSGAAETPRFDMEEARKTTRKFAVARAGKNDPAVAQLKDHPINAYPTQTPLARAIDRATRPDCKTFASDTGIFAVIVIPYVILTDKKDSGCKW